MVNYSKFRLIDHTTTKVIHGIPNTAITSFAIDDALALSVSDQSSPPILRLWSHPATVVLGIPDTRLPFIEAGIKLLTEQGYHVIVRNSGGLAVALDEGVLNMSLILPDVKRLSIEDGYEKMFRFVKHMLRHLTTDIQAYEIVGSYCPGDYDLSINGVKFAGISQRRLRDGAAIQIYLDVEGKSRERAVHIQKFYEVSRQQVETSFTYPTVNPDVLGSLSNILNKQITIEDIKQRVFQTLASFTEQIVSQSLLETELEAFNKRYEQMIKRNEKIAQFQ